MNIDQTELIFKPSVVSLRLHLQQPLVLIFYTEIFEINKNWLSICPIAGRVIRQNTCRVRGQHRPHSTRASWDRIRLRCNIFVLRRTRRQSGKGTVFMMRSLTGQICKIGTTDINIYLRSRNPI